MNVGRVPLPISTLSLVVEGAVAVGVGIEEVAEFRTLECGEIVGIAVDKRLYIVEIGLVAHDAVDFYDVELVDRTSLLGLVYTAD